MVTKPVQSAQEQKIRGLLLELTLDEKISLLSGQDVWTLPAIRRLGISSLKMSDGPTGLRSTNSDPSTVFPVGIALAATWNPDLVENVARAIGREAIAHGVDVLLAPGVNIQRTPLGGRNFEYYSEDPHLTGEIGVAYVNGVQSVGVGTSLKHFAANNQEHNRLSASSNVTARALREIYLAAFEPVVRRANPWTIMSAYNRINGVFASENDWLLNQVLKGEWGYDGVVVSDWGAAKSTIGSALGGLDIEMPGPARHYGDKLKAEIESGAIGTGILDDHVLRVLRLICRCGLMDGNPKREFAALRTPEHRALARKAAAQSMVLLKNDDQLLPLKVKRKLAVIGALADYPAIQGGGSSQVSPDRIVTPLQGLQAALSAETEIVFERGIDPEPKPPTIDGRLLKTEEGGVQGLTARYFDTPGYRGNVVDEITEWHFSKLGFGEKAQDQKGAFSVEWTGILTPRYSGPHRLRVTHSNPDVELVIDDQVLIDADTPREHELLFMILKLNRREAEITLEAGMSYPITIRYSQLDGIRGFNVFNLGLREPEPSALDAISAAREAETAILFVGSGTTSETEGEDRASMQLCADQNKLVEDVVRVNPNTIVVVNTGGPVEMPWADKVKAIVQMWLPGQEGGDAVADLITGKINPSGKLPVTFPRRYEDNPTFPYFPGDQEIEYGEDLCVGYKHYYSHQIEPLFPFGHGLSYTRFAFDHTEVFAKDLDDGDVQIVITVRNIGELEGTETVQVYLEPSASAGDPGVYKLVAFNRITLSAGANGNVKLRIPQRAFQFFDEATGQWQFLSGPINLLVGASASDIRHTLILELPNEYRRPPRTGNQDN